MPNLPNFQFVLIVG